MNQKEALREVKELIHSIGWGDRVDMSSVSLSFPHGEELYVTSAHDDDKCVNLVDYISDIFSYHMDKMDPSKDCFGLSDTDLRIEMTVISMMKDLCLPTYILISGDKGEEEKDIKDDLSRLEYLAGEYKGKLYLSYVDSDEVSGWVANIAIKWD